MNGLSFPFTFRNENLKVWVVWGMGLGIGTVLANTDLINSDLFYKDLYTFDQCFSLTSDFISNANMCPYIICLRMVYTKMAEEVCDLLVADSGEGSTREVQLSCYDTMFSSPIPEDIRSSYLQEAVSTFTHYITEAASQPSHLPLTSSNQNF